MAQTLHIHLEEYAPGGKSQTHGHVNEAVFYILDGKGSEIHDGQRYDWKAGDIAVVHNNCVHQHNNADDHAAGAGLVMKTKPMFLFMNMLFQKRVTERPKEPTATPRRFSAARGRRLQSAVAAATAPRSRPRACSRARAPTLTMAWQEAAVWAAGSEQGSFYADTLKDATERPARDAGRKKDHHPGRHAVGERAARAAQAPGQRYDERARRDRRRLHADPAARRTLGPAPPPRRGSALRPRRPRVRYPHGLRRRDHRHVPLAAAETKSGASSGRPAT